MSSDLVPPDHSALASVAPSYERMRIAIAACSRVDEVANLADQAVAAQAYFRQSQDVGNEQEASRIRVRAERRLGDILRAMAENGERQRRGDTRPGIESSAARLSDLGIPRDRASRAMQLAEVPDSEFEAALSKPRIAQPRRMLDERKPAAATPAVRVPAAESTPRKFDLATLWVQRVLDLRLAIGRGELPRPAQCRERFAPADIEKLRAALPVITRYLERVRVGLCPRCDGEGCEHCVPSPRAWP